MKRTVLFISIALFVLVVTALSLANMNVVNLVIDGTSGNSGSSARMDAFGNDNPGDAPMMTYSEGVAETLQSGLVGGEGGKLNLLWLLQNAREPNKESYAYQLLQAYSNLENGKYNDHEYHLSPEAIAGSHYNETKLSSFVVPSTSGYAKAENGILGKIINGKKITLENATKSDIVGHAPKSGSVWADKDSKGGDGYPDGPFQIIQGKQSDSFADKNRSDKKYDLYNFPDAMNVIDGKFNTIAKKYAASGSTLDGRVLNMLSAIVHNRGEAGVGWLMYGLPYDVNNGSLTSYLKYNTMSSMPGEELAITAQFPKDLLAWFDKANIPIEAITGNSKGQGVATLLVLANGGFLDIPLQAQSKKNLEALGDDLIAKIMPGQTTKTIASHVNSKYVKKPWDVLGMGKSEYDKIYASGSYSSYEEPYSIRHGYNRNTVFYIDKNLKSSNYKAGENVVVRAVEGIALGYMIDVGVSGTYTVLKVAQEAGIKSLNNGAIIDPSNPQLLYQSNSKNSETYNPAGNASSNYDKFLEGLGLAGKLSETQYYQIKAIYDVSGGQYSQPKRGQKNAAGLLYMDCSAMVTIGLYMDPTRKSYEYTGSIMDGVWLRSTGKTATVNGKSYSTKVVQLNKQGQPMPESSKMNFNEVRKDYEWIPYLQTGDIINGRTNGVGHVVTYLGKNTTGKKIVLSQDISKVSALFSTYEPDEHFTIQASGYGIRVGQDKMGLQPLSAKRGPDSTGRPYHAMRPIYNIK